jgi:hypothetical protein
MQVLDPAGQVAAEVPLDAGARAPAHFCRPVLDGGRHRTKRAQRDRDSLEDWVAVVIEDGIAHVIEEHVARDDSGSERETGPAQGA